MSNIITPKDLRDRKALDMIPNEAGYYQWWANEETVRNLLGKYYDELVPMLTKGENNLYGYFYVYVGIASRSLRQRLNWHINQKNGLSAVRSGYLSTLRQSISSLISGDQSDTDGTNKIIDTMLVEYFLSEDFREEEKSEIEKNILPLNIRSQPEPLLKNGFTKHLKDIRKKSR